MRRANVICDDQLNPSCIIPGVFTRASPTGGRRGTGYGRVIPGDNGSVTQVHQRTWARLPVVVQLWTPAPGAPSLS
jgi:hypothetical protein